MCEVLCWNTIKEIHRSWLRRAEIKDCFVDDSKCFCFTSSLIRRLYHSATDLDRVLLQLASTDIENSLLIKSELEASDIHD